MKVNGSPTTNLNQELVQVQYVMEAKSLLLSGGVEYEFRQAGILVQAHVHQILTLGDCLIRRV